MISSKYNTTCDTNKEIRKDLNNRGENIEKININRIEVVQIVDNKKVIENKLKIKIK